MKIGILTFHCAHNYGAVLQAYATQTFLESQGHEVVMVDYRPDYLVAPFRVFDWKSYWTGSVVRYGKTALQKLCAIYPNWKRAKGFDSFITNRFRLETVDFSKTSDIDAFVLGSDQIWNPALCKGFDPVYFGQIKAAENKKRIAYAASMGSFSLDEHQTNFFRLALTALDAISVREESLLHMLSPLTEKPIQQVLDPTFLVPATVWQNIARKPEKKRPYVLVYEVATHPETMSLALRLADQIQGDIVELRSAIHLFHPSPAQCASPESFVGYFREAACVVTTSFHGTAFSIIFNRPFYTLRLGNQHDARSLSLLNRLSLADRFVEGKEVRQLTAIDYKPVNACLEKEVIRSQAFLIEALQSRKS